MAQKPKKQCFLVCPIGKEHSDTRRRADYLHHQIIEPALEKLGYTVTRSDLMALHGRITEKIIDALARADLVIADFDGFNANVMYETGIRHAWNLPLIPLCPQHQSLPFDLAVINTVFYPSLRKQLRLRPAERRKMIKKIRAQAHCVELNALDKETAFSRAMREYGKRYSLEAVYLVKDTKLTALSETLKNLDHEIERDLKRTNGTSAQKGVTAPRRRTPKAGLAEFVKSVINAFENSRESLTEIVERGVGDEKNNKHCLGVCRLMESIERDGRVIAKRLMVSDRLLPVSPRAKKIFVQARNTIAKIQEQIDEAKKMICERVALL